MGCQTAVLHLPAIDGGNTWEVQTVPGFTNFSSIYFVNSSLGFAVGTLGRVYKTIDGGIHWTLRQLPLYGTLRSVFFIADLNGWISGNYQTVWYTTDAGVSWSRSSTLGATRA